MASGGTTSSNRVYHFRLQTLIIDGGTLVLRKIFDQKLPNVPLNVFLANEKTTINRLRGSKTITEPQYDLLYPQSGQQPKSSDFDITLIICLLRNLRSLGLNHKYNWHAAPQPGDTSVEADLCRLKGFRNEIAHIASLGIQPVLFQTKWTEIEQVLLRLNSAVPNPDPNLQQTIDDYQSGALDDAEEKRIQNEIRQWREMEKGLEIETEIIKKDLKEVDKGVKEVHKGVTKVDEDVKNLEKDVTKVSENVTQVSKDVKEIEHGVTRIGEEVKQTTKGVTEVIEDVRKVAKGIEQVSKDVEEVGEGVTKVDEDVKNLEKDVTKVSENVTQVSKDVKEIEHGVTRIGEEVKQTTKGVTEVNEDVRKVAKGIEQVSKDVEEVGEGVTQVDKDVKKVVKVITKVSEDVEKVAKAVSNVSENIAEVKEMKEGVMELNSKVDGITKGVQELNTVVRSDSRGQKKPGVLQRVKNFLSSRKSRLKDLERGMVLLYRNKHSKCQLSPLLDNDPPLLEFYVMPNIESVDVRRGRGSVKEEKTHITQFSKVFFKENKMCNEIYLTADAGLGKTAFSKRLALAWCHVKKPLGHEKKYFSMEEIEAISRFRFVFLLLLRDSSSECDIDDLILKQIISQIPHTGYTLNDIENILAKETCLVILDGLDEWNHPSNSCNQGWSSIPHRKARGCTAVLTTTRPWKLSVIDLGPSQIDKKLEITGLNNDSTNTLKSSVLSHLFAQKGEIQLTTSVTEFTKAVEDRHISDLEKIPLILMYLLFLWYYKIEMGKSLCDLYSNFVELLLSRTAKLYEIPLIVEHTQDDIPPCFSKLKHCKLLYSRLKYLGHLAYQTLFKETREENTLVFDRSVAQKYLDEQCLIFFLKAGIISESKVPGTMLENISKVSFAHKTVHEFFAALYIHSTPEQTSVQEIVLSKCKCVEDILKMSKIFIFLSGLNVNVTSSISRELMTIINEDEITREYRSSLGDGKPLQQFQDMCVSCCKELPQEHEVNLCLQDVFIHSDCKQEQYLENLKQLTTRNKQNIRSLFIEMRNTPSRSPQEITEYFALSNLGSIEKIQYGGEYNDRDILPLLNWSVRSLSLLCTEIPSSWSVSLYEKVTCLQKLEAIYFGWFELSHERLTLLYDYISQRHSMRGINLEGLDCTDHMPSESCTGCRLDLSQHSQLRDLCLYYIPVSELNINMSSLERCTLLSLSNPDLVLRFINCVPAHSKVNEFHFGCLKCHATVDTIHQTLPLYVHVENIGLMEMNLGNRELLTSEMVNIKIVQLRDVIMSASVLRGIVTVLQKLPQTVTVFIHHCNIAPLYEIDRVKKEIEQSSKFRPVTWYNRDRFSFDCIIKTIEDGD